MVVEESSRAAETYLSQAGFPPLSDGWEVVQVGELLSEDRGISVGVMYPGEHDPNGVPLIKAGDLTGSLINTRPDFRITPKKHYEYRRTEFSGGEILMTLVGDIGQCAVVPPAMAGWNSARAVAVIRLRDPDDAIFVRLCLLSKPIQHLMDVWANTTVQPTLNLKEIRQLPLPWPPKHQRDAITEIVMALDDKIELNRRMNETLEGMARAIFKSWFVDFDPVRAKLDGRQPPGLNAETAALFPDRFEHVNGEPVPKGWSVQRWGDIATLEYGKSLREYKFASGPYRVFGTNGPIGRHTETLCDTAGIIIGRKGAYRGVHYSPEPFFVIDTAFYLQPKTEFDLKWAFYELLSFDINSMDSGSAIPSTSREDFYAIPVCVPSTELLRAFGRTLDPLYARKFANDRQNATLAVTRDALLPKLLSGEIRVGDAESLLEGVG
jgi:type I restriction enzyme S subunit